VFREWHKCFGEEPIRVKALIDKAYERPMSHDVYTDTKLTNADLLDALTAVCNNGIGKLDVPQVSQWISQHKDKIVDGLKITAGTMYCGYGRWTVIKV
jgi:hypothetical protein